MSGTFTKSMARNIFYGGTVFFFLFFLALTFDTERTSPQRDNREALTDQVKAGKRIWETRNCVGCHTILGEGAYFAPELGNVYKRRGAEFIKVWINAQPSGTPGRRQMPHFELSESEMDELIAFLKYASEIKTSNWPPNDEG
ncbi:MAG: cytochrome c [Azoarcus sp.]|jgi:nitric oxide reductase subunit C|nr:cytochrome c [Azoarcus sp.]